MFRVSLQELLLQLPQNCYTNFPQYHIAPLKIIYYFCIVLFFYLIWFSSYILAPVSLATPSPSPISSIPSPLGCISITASRLSKISQHREWILKKTAHASRVTSGTTGRFLFTYLFRTCALNFNSYC